MNKALFLDRDGVINIDKKYVYRVEDFEFIDGIIETLKIFQDNGYLLIIITNQAGIGRGYYTEDDFQYLNRWMIQKLKEQSIIITRVYYSPYHPEQGIGMYKRHSDCRKPNPGMIKQAQVEFNIDLKRSVLVGDKESDILAGINAGIKLNVLLSSDQIVANSKANLIITKITDLMNVFD